MIRCKTWKVEYTSVQPSGAHNSMVSHRIIVAETPEEALAIVRENQ